MLDNLSLFSARWWCLYLILGCIVLSSCNSEPSNPIPNTIDSNTLIILDVYRGSAVIGLSLIYSAKQSTIIIKSNGRPSLDFAKAPPPPLGVISDEKSLSFFEKINLEILNLDQGAVKSIENLLNKFEAIDFETVNNSLKIENGLAIKVIIINSDSLIGSFSLINGATDNQGDLLKFISNLVIQKSRLNQEQLNFFLR